MEEAMEVLEKIKLPLVIRPSFTLGGTGGGIARDARGFLNVLSPTASSFP